MVLHKNFLTPNAVLAHVQEYGSHAFPLYCLRNPKRLSDLIEGALQWRVLRVQVSQAHHDGNPDFRWPRGAALTAPLDGLWDVMSPVMREDVRHMQSRVIQFDIHVPVAGDWQPIPHCAQSWCKYVREGSAAYASKLSRSVPAERVQGLPIADEDP
ncbi:unnamed protein product [Symbiodinium microadriaticum]|nr:unnamed protein product [Symbiodinium microadriaticum]